MTKEKLKLWNGKEMPLSMDNKKRKAQEKMMAGEKLSIEDKIALGGRDNKYLIKEFNGYIFKPDCAYRVVERNVFNFYISCGYIVRNIEEYIPFQNNGGVDWYLGGACLRYGGSDKIIIECPADKSFFVPTIDNGLGEISDPTIRHLKSSSKNNPIPIEMITTIFDLKNNLINFKQKENSQSMTSYYDYSKNGKTR